MRIALLSIALLTQLLPAAFAQQNPQNQLPNRKIGPEILDAIESHFDIVYARYGDRELALDLFLPKERNPEAHLPVVICIHGGAWWKGEKKNIRALAQALAARGYATTSISYRLSGELPFPAQIHDAKAAVRWLRANADKWNLNPEAIAVTGSSAGGHLAALLATSGDVTELEGEGGNPDESSRVQAAIPMGAQSDLESERILERSKDPKAAFYPQFLGGAQDEVPETYQLASPRHHIDASDPPMLFMTGELDHPSTRAAEVRAELEKLGIPTGLHVIPGAPHGFLMKQPYFDKAVDLVDAFLEKQLGKP